MWSKAGPRRRCICRISRRRIRRLRSLPAKNFLYGAEFFEGKLYITTNEDAPHYRVFVADATNAKRDNWKELIPQTDAVLQNASVTGGKLLAQYEHNATSELKLFGLDGKKLADIPLPAIGDVFSTSGRYDRNEIFFGFQSFTVPPSVYRVDLTDVKSCALGQGRRALPSILPPMTCSRFGTPRKTARKFRCLSSTKRESRRTARTRLC